MLSVKQFLFLTYASVLRILYSIYFLFQNKPGIENIVEVPKPVYGELFKSRFRNSFSDLENLNLNANIDNVFYNKKQLQTALIEADNDLEKRWRSRILMESSPRGNIIMYYDAYKIGFAYYSDQYIPYDILNAVAMKYVITFQCRDFFMDELERPKDYPSKLLALFEEEKKAPSESKSFKNQLRDGPFAKFKNYNNVSTKAEPNKDNEIPEPVKDKVRNCFISRGKIANFSLLQKPEIKNNIIFNKNESSSDMVKGLFDNSSVQKEVFGYRDFKAARLKQD
jgi:hypothetical protein